MKTKLIYGFPPLPLLAVLGYFYGIFICAAVKLAWLLTLFHRALALP